LGTVPAAESHLAAIAPRGLRPGVAVAFSRVKMLPILGLTIVAAIMPVVGFETLGVSAVQSSPATVLVSPASSDRVLFAQVSNSAVTISRFDDRP
jgi:C4-dicarboxylate transporter